MIERSTPLPTGGRVVEVCGIPFRLPNEKRQFILLEFIGEYVSTDGTVRAVMDTVDPAAAIIGACWHHPEYELETPQPWKAIKLVDRTMPLEARQDCRATILADFGEEVLDELDSVGLGQMSSVVAIFGELVDLIGKSFASQEVIQNRLGFTRPKADTNDTSDSAVV